MRPVTISSTYQVVIPRDIRDQFNLKPGQKLVFISFNGTIRVIVPPIERAKRLLKGLSTDNLREEVDEESR
ncbi:MAG: AbrB/MazE/SpoVT family DNA-binding domain-containing protein [Methanothrix sp.]|nr:AbrB/MazE/SpoVT family DNA-binding domain-containing protein [Methanothrix sp.]